MSFALRAWFGGCVAAALVAGSAPAVAVATPDPPPMPMPMPAAPTSGSDSGRWVTLVTGDRVLVPEGDDRDVTIRPAKGRESVPFHRFSHNGELFVVPIDAEPSIAAGRLDRELFKVSTSGAGTPATSEPSALALQEEEESYDVTMTFLDHHGRPTDQYSVALFDVANPSEYYPFDPSGTVVVRLPKGQYFLSAQVMTPDPTQEPGFLATLVHEPMVEVTGDLALTFDARDGRQFGASVDRPASQRIETWVGSGRALDWTFVSDSYSGWGMDFFLVRPSTTVASADRFEFRVRTTLGEPNGAPYLYNIQWSHHGRVPADLMPRIRDRELAVVHTQLSATGGPDRTVGKINPAARWAAPAKITEYYTPDAGWHGEWLQFGTDLEWPEAALFSAPRIFRLGKPVTERWFAAVFGPALPAGAGQTWAGRRGDTLSIDLPMHVDQNPDRYGGSTVDSGRTSLYRDGQKIAENEWPGSGFFELPAESAAYRLEVEATRSLSQLSSRVSSAWTFRSEQVAVQDPKAPPQPVPLMAIRFAPKLDDHNRAQAGRRFSFPVYVQRQDGADYGALVNLAVQVSFDDGATWIPALLEGGGLTRTVTVDHPEMAGFVSLKATATDSAGNGVEQTIIHAYELCRTD